jgi:DNA polymerase III subunit epsilon
MHRSIVFAVQSERTGYDYSTDLHSISCVELLDRKITSNTYGVYVFPRRLDPDELSKITGCPKEVCADFFWFDDTVDGFRSFVSDAELIFHDAKSSISTINAELGRLNRPFLIGEEFIDTCDLVDEFVGEPTHLVWFATQHGISVPERGDPMIDCARLNAEIYLELKGDRYVSSN